MACIQQNGIYALINAKGGTCLDLSGGDNTSIIGYGFHNGPNQAWLFESTGQGQVFRLKSVGTNKYLAAAGPGEPRDGQKVIAGDMQYDWYVEDAGDNCVRILPSNNRYFCVDLSDHGNSNPGTPVELWGKWEGQNQIWRLNKLN